MVGKRRAYTRIIVLKGMKKMAMNNSLSKITLNINGLNATIKRHTRVEWIRKHDPHICCLKESHLRTKDLHRLKVNGWKQVSKKTDRKKKAGVE